MFWLAAILPALGAIGGGIAGYASVMQRGDEEKAALKQQKDSAWKQYEYGKAHGDRMFGIQKAEALENLGVQRKNLDEQVGLSTDEYNTALLAQAFGIQDARIQTGSAIGASLAEEGASGVRGSATGDKIRAYALQGLERNIEAQDRQNAGQLNRMIAGANMTAGAIGREEASWMPGGYRMQQKDAQDSYNLNVANLGQDNFQWQIDNAAPTDLDKFVGVMSGMQSGFSLGNSANQFAGAWFGVGK